MSLRTKPARPKRCNSPRPLSAFATLCVNERYPCCGEWIGSDEPPLRDPVGPSHRPPHCHCRACIHPSSPAHRTDDATRQAIRSSRSYLLAQRRHHRAAVVTGELSHRTRTSPSHLLIKIDASPPSRGSPHQPSCARTARSGGIRWAHRPYLAIAVYLTCIVAGRGQQLVQAS
jgi:hypothetical protein